MLSLTKFTVFEWDKNNVDKSYKKHGITPNETEEIFLDEKLKVEADVKHSQTEDRFIAIGKTSEQKVLFVVFTLCQNKIRVVSTRPANKKERRIHEKSA